MADQQRKGHHSPERVATKVPIEVAGPDLLLAGHLAQSSDGTVATLADQVAALPHDVRGRPLARRRRRPYLRRTPFAGSAEGLAQGSGGPVGCIRVSPAAKVLSAD